MKQHTLLLIAEFEKPWNSGWYYKTGLEKNGHRVIPFDPAAIEKPEDMAIEIIKGQGPDLVLHAKDELPAECFQRLRGQCKVIMWYPDPVIPEWLPAYVRACDVFLTMSEGLVPEFQKYNEHVFWLSQAFEPDFFEINEITEDEKKIFSTDVAFVGNLGSKTQYLMRRGALERVINDGFKLKWWGPRLPRKFSTLPLIFGKLGKSYGGKFVWGQEYAKVAQLSKIFLAFDSMPDIRKSMSARMYTAVGCGAFYMCQYVEGIEEVLEPDSEIVTFRSEEEMIEKIIYYLRHDDVRVKIAEAGQRKVLEKHTYEVRMRQLIKLIEGGGAPGTWK